MTFTKVQDVFDRDAWIFPADGCSAGAYDGLQRFAPITTPYGVWDYEEFNSGGGKPVEPVTGCSGAQVSGGVVNGGPDLSLTFGRYFRGWFGNIDRGADKIAVPLDPQSPTFELEFSISSDKALSDDTVEIDIFDGNTDEANAIGVYYYQWGGQVDFDIVFTSGGSTVSHSGEQQSPLPGTHTQGEYKVALTAEGATLSVGGVVISQANFDLADEVPTFSDPRISRVLMAFFPDSEATYTQLDYIAIQPAGGGSTSVGGLYNRTWDGAANAIESLEANGYYSVQAPVGTSNAVVGLTANLTSDSTVDIDYAVHFRSGQYRILQNGLIVTDFAPFGSSDWFRLVRNEDVVRILHDDGNSGDLWGIPGGVVHTFAPQRPVKYTMRALFRNVGDALTGYELTTFQFVDDDGNLRGEDAADATQSGTSGGVLHLVGRASAEPYSDAAGTLSLTGSVAVHLRGDSAGVLTLEGRASEGGLFYAAGDLVLTGAAEGGFAEGFRYAIGYLQHYGYATGRAPNAAHGLIPVTGLSAFSGYGEAQGDLLLAGVADGGPRDDNYLVVSLGTLQFDADVETTQVQSNALMHTATRQVYARTVQEWFFAATRYQAAHAHELTLQGLAAVVPKTFYNPQVEHQDLAEVQVEAQTAIRLTLQLLAAAADDYSLREALVHWLRATADDPVETTRHRAAEMFLRSHIQDLGVDGVDAINVDDVLEAVTSLSLQQQALLMELIEAAAIPQASMHIQVSDALEADAEDTLQTLLHRVAEVEDAAGIWVVLRTDADVIQGWVMNTEGQRPLSQYDNYDFNSLCRIGDRYFGARDDGVYLLEGADDEGQAIDSAVRSMMLDFGSTRQKRVTSAYLGYKSDGKLLLKVRSVDDGQLVENWYEAQQVTADAPRAGYRTLGRGMRSRYWQFELVNVAGADFELDKLELHPVYLSRRV